MARYESAAKKPPIAWRITRVFLHITGQIILWALIAAGTLAIIAVIAGSIFLSKFSDYLKTDVIPAAEDFASTFELDNDDMAQTSIILFPDENGSYYDAKGNPYELQQLYSNENRIWASYDEISDYLKFAAVAIEDKRFYDHDGVDWIRTISAVGNFVGGDASYGASTITQQLIKNLSQEDEVTIHRKVQEIFRALAFEQQHSKQEILEWYLNTVYFGNMCYGVESAAQVYFAKKTSAELTAAEAASIIAITNNPSLYDPYVNPEGNRNRQVLILKEMCNQGYISEEQLEKELAQEMVFRNGRNAAKSYECLNPECDFDGMLNQYIRDPEDEDTFRCPKCNAVNPSVEDNKGYSYFVDTVYRDVVDDLSEQFGVKRNVAERMLLTGGYRIYATIDKDIQKHVDDIYQNLENVPKTSSAQQLQSAIVVIDNATGDIVAICGGVGEKEGSLTYNRAEALLPTGSAVKPISVYAPALEAGVVTPATALEDSSFYDEGEPNWPLNSNRRYDGMTLVLRGLQRSLNTISVKTLDRLGLQESYNFLTQKMGITTLVEHEERSNRVFTDIAYAPLGLGEQTYGMTVREVTQAYATFPNNGTFREARTYTKVVDAEGNTVLENLQESHTALGTKASYYINYMLESAVTSSYGTGTPAAMSYMTVAGKTGTSNNSQTRWFAGYTPYYTAVVWCGYDEPEQIVMSGTNPAITMWNHVMRPLHAELERRDFVRPSGVITCSVCADCGMLAADSCKDEVRGSRLISVKLFDEDAPKTYCKCHQIVTICKSSGMVATEFCPETVEKGMLIFNEEWKVHKDDEHVYNPEKAKTCTEHTHAPEPEPEPEPTVEPTEPATVSPFEPTEPVTVSPFESVEPDSYEPTAQPQGTVPPEEDWYGKRKIEW